MELHCGNVKIHYTHLEKNNDEVPLQDGFIHWSCDESMKKTNTKQINEFRMIWRSSVLWSHCVFPSEEQLWIVDWGMIIAMRYTSWIVVEIDLWSLQIPKNCSSTMMFDLFYRILPRDLTQTPIHINTFLPVFTLTGKNKLWTTGYHGSSMKLYWMNRRDTLTSVIFDLYRLRHSEHSYSSSSVRSSGIRYRQLHE